MAVARSCQIAIIRVPEFFAFKKPHLVSESGQATHETTIGGRVTVAPRRGDRQSENYDAQMSRHKFIRPPASVCVRPTLVRRATAPTAPRDARRYARP